MALRCDERVKRMCTDEEFNKRSVFPLVPFKLDAKYQVKGSPTTPCLSHATSSH